MSTGELHLNLSLAWYARWLLIVAAMVAKHTSFRVPHKWVVAVTNRSWRIQDGLGYWHPIRINNQGRIL